MVRGEVFRWEQLSVSEALVIPKYKKVSLLNSRALPSTSGEKTELLLLAIGILEVILELTKDPT